MLFADLVATSAAVAATPEPGEKIARLAKTLRRLTPEEIAPKTREKVEQRNHSTF